MNKLILCEGKTDAILLSYLLQKVQNWKRVDKNAPDVPPLKIRYRTNSDEYAYWYKKNSDFLLICSVGGVDNFENFFTQHIRTPTTVGNLFSKIAIVADRDENDEVHFLERMKNWVAPIELEPVHNQWMKGSYAEPFDSNEAGITRSIDVLFLIIPLSDPGALEKVLLDALCEDPETRIIVEHSKNFVDELSPKLTRYLKSRRQKQKSILAVTWAVQSPEKNFNFIDEQILAYQWEQSAYIQNSFKALFEI